MSRQGPSTIAVGLWTAAVAGAILLLIAPLTPWIGTVELIGLVVCLSASVALVVWMFAG